MKKDFWSRLEITPTCWLWVECRSMDGYGAVHCDGKFQRAHRVAWQLRNGSIPVGAHVLHTCDVRTCCNPDHLFLGTNADNVADKVSKKRQSRGSMHGKSKLTEDEARLIREVYTPGKGFTQAQLGDVFGVSASTVSLIHRGLHWKHVDEVACA